jgi:O-antigen ligase
MTLIQARIITAVLIGIMVLIFFSPIHMCMIYLFIRPLVQPFAYHEFTFFGDFPLTSVFSLMIIGSAYVNGFFKHNNTLRLNALIPLYLMLYFSCMSFISTPSYAVSIAHVLKILSAMAIYMLVYNSIQSKEDMNKILWIYLLGSVIPMLFGYYQYITGTGHAWAGQFYAGKRIDSFLGEYNAYGEYLSITITAALMLFFQENIKGKRIAILAILGSLALSMILSKNRGSWIALYTGFLFASFFYRRKIKLWSIILVTIILAAAFGGAIYERFQELHQLSSFGNPQDTLQGRLHGWAALLPIALDKPFFGHGVGAIVLIAKKHLQITFAPHNDYLRLSVEIGIFGMLFYLFFLLAELVRSILNIRRKSENWRINYPMFIAVIYFIIISFFQNIIYNVTVFPMFLGLLGLTHKYNFLSQHDVQKKS